MIRAMHAQADICERKESKLSKKNKKNVSAAPKGTAPSEEKIKDVINRSLDEAESAEKGAEEKAEVEQPKAHEEPAPAVVSAPEAQKASLDIMHLHADPKAEAHEEPAPSVQPAPQPKAAPASVPPEAPKKKHTGLLAVLAIVIGLITICLAGYDVRLKQRESAMMKSKANMDSQLVMTVSTDIPVISAKNGLTYAEDPNPIISKIPDQLRPYIGSYPSEGDIHIDGLEALNLAGTHTVTFVLTDSDQYGQTVEKTYTMMVEVAEGNEALSTATAEPSASPEAIASPEAEASASADAEEAQSDIPTIGINDSLGPDRPTPTPTAVATATPTATPDDTTVTIISDGQTACEDSNGTWNDVTGVCSYN